MNIFKRKPKLQNPQVIERLKYQHMSYVSTRDSNGVETVLGRNGGVNIRNDEIIVFADGKDVFRCNMYQAEVGELMSRDGVRLAKTLENGEKFSVIVHFTK